METLIVSCIDFTTYYFGVRARALIGFVSMSFTAWVFKLQVRALSNISQATSQGYYPLE